MKKPLLFTPAAVSFYFIFFSFQVIYACLTNNYLFKIIIVAVYMNLYYLWYRKKEKKSILASTESHVYYEL